MDFLNGTTDGTLQFVKELQNVTRDTGQNVGLKCVVRNLDTNATTPAKVRIKWLQNEVEVDEKLNKPRMKITIKHSKEDPAVTMSKLKIENLEVHDKGFYTCIASNGISKINSTAVLQVNLTKRGALVFGDIPNYEPVFQSTKDYFQTAITPSVEKKYHREVFPTPSDNSLLPTDNIDMLPTLMEDTMKNPVLFDINSVDAFEPICQIYNGTNCAVFLKNQPVFVQPPYTQKQIEEKLQNAFLVIKHSKDISSNCEAYAIPSLCYSAFPICINPEETNSKFIKNHKIQTRNIKAQTKKSNNNMKIVKRNVDTDLKDGPNSPSNDILKRSIEPNYKKHKPLDTNFTNLRNEISLKRICRPDCEILENELCRVEYAIAKRHPLIGRTLTLEECMNLPDLGTEAAHQCLPLGIDYTASVQPDEDCFWGTGQDYRGAADTSINNRKCIKWSHQFQFQLSEHPELAGAHSYCRNPGGHDLEPWCYVEPNEKETCDVPKCAYRIWMIIAIVILIFLLAFAAFVSYICCTKEGKRNHHNLQNMPVPSADKNIYGNSRLNSPVEVNSLPSQSNNIPSLQRTHGNNKNAMQRVPTYTMKEVTFVQELGEGAFGKVYKGELKTKQGRTFVAVKALKENASAKTQADFKREIDLISELRHPNIVCLLGVIAKQEPVCMLFEYMEQGDLHEFLINNSPNEGKNLSQDNFLYIAIQIASGMEYLSGHHYVHRDLAARNCLVGTELTVKISDFGLSRDIYSSDYYRVQSKSLLPVRWMPPESILYGKFTTESDIWSYGVVLWEIYSYGLQPYYGHNNQEVIDMIRSRQLLPCPDACPSYCYALMVECWCELAMRRPSFAEISHRLRVWRQNGNAIMSASKDTFLKPSETMSPQRTAGVHKSPNAINIDLEAPSVSFSSDRHKEHSSDNLNESLSSRSSVKTASSGNKTQSTNLSSSSPAKKGATPRNKKGYASSSQTSVDSTQMQPLLGQQPKFEVRNTLVQSTGGENYETKLTY